MPLFPARQGTFSQLPSPGNAGKQFRITDAPVGLWIDDGVSMCPDHNGILGARPPLSASFTLVNAPATFEDFSGSLRMIKNVPGSSEISLAVQTITSASFSVECALFMQHAAETGTTDIYPFAGVCMRESGTGKIAVWMLGHDINHVGNNVNTYFNVGHWSSPTTNTLINDQFGHSATFWRPTFQRLRFDGTNLNYDISYDRQKYRTIASEVATAAFTSAPNQVGIVIYGPNPGVVHEVVWTHFVVTSP